MTDRVIEVLKGLSELTIADGVALHRALITMDRDYELEDITELCLNAHCIIEQTPVVFTYRVIPVLSVDLRRKIQAIKTVRNEVEGMGLKEAKDFVEDVITWELSANEADVIYRALTGCGYQLEQVG